jgi:hypothetical protein
VYVPSRRPVISNRPSALAVTTAPADKRVEAFIKIADGVEACGCKVNIPWLKAAYYLLQRGP